MATDRPPSDGPSRPPSVHMLATQAVPCAARESGMTCASNADSAGRSKPLATPVRNTTPPPGTRDAESGWRATGDGVVDWKTLWPLFKTTAADHLVVEHDSPVDWLNVARRSYDFSVAKGLAR